MLSVAEHRKAQEFLSRLWENIDHADVLSGIAADVLTALSDPEQIIKESDLIKKEGIFKDYLAGFNKYLENKYPPEKYGMTVEQLWLSIEFIGKSIS